MFLLAWHLQAAVLLGDQRAAVALSERLKCVAICLLARGSIHVRYAIWATARHSLAT